MIVTSPAPGPAPADTKPDLRTVASFATYAAGFGARPLGAVLSGHFGDRLGRQTALVTALLISSALAFVAPA